MPYGLKERAYIAGIIDGEGSIVISKSYRKAKRYNGKPIYSLQITVEMGCREIPEYLIQVIRKGSLQSRIRPNHQREMFSWIIYGKDAKKFLEEIKNELVYKKREAEIAIEFQETLIKKGRKRSLPQKIWDLKEQFYLNLKRLHYAI